MYHPAAALRTPAVEQASYADIGFVPAVLDDARARRAGREDAPMTDQPAPAPPALDQLTLFR
jgi:hypothetical protein